MGFWKNIQILLGITPEEYINVMPSIHEAIYIMIDEGIELNEYNMEQYSLLTVMLNEEAAVDCLKKNINVYELKAAAEAKKLHPMFYYLIYISNETKGEV
jgi:hypothetical protein